MHSSNLRGSSGGRVSAVGNNEKIGSKLRLFRKGRHQHEVTRDTKGEMMANSCHFYLTHGLALCKAKTKCLGIGHKSTQCLKITEKVSFNMASEVSCVYILNGQKFINNGQKWSI